MECTQGTLVWLDIMVKLAPAFVALVVGTFGAYIGFNQYRTNRDKLRLDLFDKRFAAYEQLQEFFNCLLRDARITDEALPILAVARYKSLFLFGDEISKHIDEVWNKAVTMRLLDVKLHGSNALPVGEERTKLCEKQSELLQWHLDQQRDSPTRYAKYLKFM